MTKKPDDKPAGFLCELRRRKVFRIAVVYVIVAWVLIQIADTVFDPLQLPDWAITLVITLTIIGFPFAVVLAWAYESTPDGVRRTGPAIEYSQGGASASVTAMAPESDQPSIAVLPFVNMSDSRENEYFSDGLAEELLTMLTRISSLKVCSRSSSFAYRGKDIHIPTVARKLGVTTIVEGSVQRAGDRVRITVQVIDAANDDHLWAKKYDRKLDDIFAVQDEIAEQIVASLHLTLSLAEQKSVTDQTTDNFEAYDFYLQGLDHYHRSDPGHLATAMRMFDRAIERDPDYALAQAGRAYCLADTFLYRRHDEPTLDRASDASTKAVELAEHLAEPHTARGMVLTAAEDYAAAAQSFERAISISPNFYEALNFYGRMARASGDIEKSLELYRRAAIVRPDDFHAHSMIAYFLRDTGSEDKKSEALRASLESAEKAVAADASNSRAMCILALSNLQNGDVESGRSWIERALRVAPDIAGTSYNAACFYALMGETDTAIDYLERSFDLGNRAKVWFEEDTDLDSIRDHARFKALMERF